MDDTTGSRIKKRRKELGLSVDEVAAQLGKGPATLYRYEKYDQSKIPAQMLDELAAILNTTVSYLTGFIDDPGPNGEACFNGKKIVQRGTPEGEALYAHMVRRMARGLPIQHAINKHIDSLTAQDISSIVSYISFLAHQNEK